jgi:hypothetical protein
MAESFDLAVHVLFFGVGRGHLEHVAVAATGDKQEISILFSGQGLGVGFEAPTGRDQAFDLLDVDRGSGSSHGEPPTQASAATSLRLMRRRARAPATSTNSPWSCVKKWAGCMLPRGMTVAAIDSQKLIQE